MTITNLYDKGSSILSALPKEHSKSPSHNSKIVNTLYCIALPVNEYGNEKQTPATEKFIANVLSIAVGTIIILVQLTVYFIRKFI